MIALLAVGAIALGAVVAFGVWQARLAARDADEAERARAEERLPRSHAASRRR